MTTVSLPDARELPDVVPEALRLRALRGCELGWSEAEVAELWGALEKPFADGGRPTSVAGWKPCPVNVADVRSEWGGLCLTSKRSTFNNCC